MYKRQTVDEGYSMKYSTHSALRSATERASLDFYDGLVEKTLLTIQRLSRNHNDITVERIKRELGINYKVLNKVLLSLSNDGAIEFYVSPDKRDNYTTSDMHVELTQFGINMSRRAVEILLQRGTSA